MFEPSSSSSDRAASVESESAVLAERVETLAAWIQEIDSQVRATVAAGDADALKELTRALEAWSKHDPKLEDRVTNRVDVLADRLATLAGTVNATALSLAGKDGEIAALRRELERGTARIEALVEELRESGASTEIAELRRTVAALAGDRQARADKRPEVLPGKIDVLSERLDTLAATVATTAAGLAGREGELATLRRQLEDGTAHVDRLAADVRHRLDGVFAERLDSLASAVAAATASLAGREREVGALRARLEDGTARIDSVVEGLRRSLDALSEHVARVDERSGDPETVQLLADRLDDMSGRVDSVAARLDAIAASVAAASGRLADKELELAAIHRHFEEATSRADAAVGELREALAGLPEQGSVGPAVEARLAALGERLDSLTGQLRELEAVSSARWRDDAVTTVELERQLAGVADRLAGAERSREAAAAELARAKQAWVDERTWVRAQLDSLASAVDDAQRPYDEVVPKLEVLAARVNAFERGREAIGAEVERLVATWADERNELRAQLEALAASLEAAQAAPSVPLANEETERFLAELADRLDTVERDGAAVTSEIARSTAFWASELGSIEERLEQVSNATVEVASELDAETGRRLSEVAGRIEALERDRGELQGEIARASEIWASDRSSLEARLEQVANRVGDAESSRRPGDTQQSGEIEQIRVLMDGLRLRLASTEKEVAGLASVRDLAARLDQLTWRLDSLETSAAWLAPSSAPGPVQGDGRFRMELRGLELRMEHAEAAARENREAVLVQLERLAARIEWRLQQLEGDQPGVRSAGDAAVPAHGNVVPIRGEA